MTSDVSDKEEPSTGSDTLKSPKLYSVAPAFAGHLYPMRPEKGTCTQLARARSGNQAGSRATPSARGPQTLTASRVTASTSETSSLRLAQRLQRSRHQQLRQRVGPAPWESSTTGLPPIFGAAQDGATRCSKTGAAAPYPHLRSNQGGQQRPPSSRQTLTAAGPQPPPTASAQQPETAGPGPGMQPPCPGRSVCGPS